METVVEPDPSNSGSTTLPNIPVGRAHSFSAQKFLILIQGRLRHGPLTPIRHATLLPMSLILIRPMATDHPNHQLFLQTKQANLSLGI